MHFLEIPAIQFLFIDWKIKWFTIAFTVSHKTLNLMKSYINSKPGSTLWVALIGKTLHIFKKTVLKGKNHFNGAASLTAQGQQCQQLKRFIS